MKNEREIAKKYLEEVSKKASVLTAFIYGHPDGYDIDICIITHEKEKVCKAPEPIDQILFTPEEFKAATKKYPDKLVEMRTLRGKDYLIELLKECCLPKDSKVV